MACFAGYPSGFAAAPLVAPHYLVRYASHLVDPSPALVLS